MALIFDKDDVRRIIQTVKSEPSEKAMKFYYRMQRLCEQTVEQKDDKPDDLCSTQS